MSVSRRYNRTGSGEQESWEAFFAEEYGRFAPETRAGLLELLPDDWSFEGKRVMDFGCGPGRTLRQFTEEAETGEFWGVDIDETSIEGLRDTKPLRLRTLICDPDPPLELESESFDLIWCISVFTHLTDNSAAWIIELHRLLKPGGLLMANYMGPNHSEILAGEPWDENRIGMNVLYHNRSRAQGTPMVFISDWWMREHWGRLFEVEQIIDVQNQTWPLLKKKEAELTPEDLMLPGNDPREAVALRHNIAQVQSQVEAEQEAHVKAIYSLRHEYEDSMSWKVTAPLRKAMARLRRDG